MLKQLERSGGMGKTAGGGPLELLSFSGVWGFGVSPRIRVRLEMHSTGSVALLVYSIR